ACIVDDLSAWRRSRYFAESTTETNLFGSARRYFCTKWPSSKVGRILSSKRRPRPFTFAVRKKAEEACRWTYSGKRSISTSWSPPRNRCRSGCESFTSPVASDRKSTRLNSSHVSISYAVFCLKKNKHENRA